MRLIRQEIPFLPHAQMPRWAEPPASRAQKDNIMKPEKTKKPMNIDQPNRGSAETHEGKRMAVVEDFKAGLPRKQIAEKHGVPESTISSWARQAGCPQRPRGSRSPMAPSTRDQLILRRRREGMPVKQIAKEFGLSVATIFGVCKKWAAWAKTPTLPVNGEHAGQLPQLAASVDATIALHEADVLQTVVASDPPKADSCTPAPAESLAPTEDPAETVVFQHELPEAPAQAAAAPTPDGPVKDSAWDPEPGPFPIHALNPVMRQIAEETAKIRRVAVELSAMTAVAAFAGSLGKGWKCAGAVNGCETYGNLYVVIGAGQSYGKGVATAIMKPLLRASDEIAGQFKENARPLLKVEQKLLAKRQKHLLDMLTNPRSSESLDASEERRLQLDMVHIERRMAEIRALSDFHPTYWVGNVTSAALTGLLARNGQALMSFSTEAGELVRIVLGKFNRDESADLDLFLIGYTVEAYRESRVGRGDTSLVPWLSSCWLCQPCILRELLRNREAMNRGMVARTLHFVVEPGETPMDDGIVRDLPEAVSRGWAALIKRTLTLRSQASEPVVITCSPQAREIFRSFFNEATRLGNESYQESQGVLGRWRENAIRIAVGQCVADSLTDSALADAPLMLTEDQARRAVGITLWCCRSGLKMQAAARRDELRTQRDQLSRLLSRCKGKMTVRDLRDRHGYDEAEVKVLAQAFPDRLELTEEKPPVGRPSRVLVLRTSLEA